MALCRLWIHLLLFTLCSAQNDFFTSIGHMTDLLLTEKTLVASLKDYIRAEENKLEQIKKWADKVEALSVAAIKDPEGFLGHPVNAFKLMRRLNKEWAEQGNAALIDVSGAFIANLTIQRQYFPNDVDQNGAAEALMRLLDTYQLDTETLSSGRLPGSSPDSSQHSLLTADDCFDLGTVAYSKEDYYQSELWMVQALKQMEDGETPKTADTATILDYLSFSVYQQGAVVKAFEYTKRLLELEPTHQRALGNMKYFEDVLGKRMKAKKRKGGQPKEGPREGRPADYLLERDKYEELCRGEGIKMTPRRQSRLFCRYYDNDRHPKYVIGPVKQEDEWDRPRIVRYHDIVSDREIEKVKEIAKPRLRRATVHNPQTGQLTTAHYRVAKSAWIRAFEHPLVDRINQRIEDLTGLDLSTAEALQVANYGVGGQYEPHYDFGREDEPDVFKKWGTGNRIATWLLYMSDVSAGGTTVFTDVGAVIVPKKGSAVFWFNLHPSGEGDYRTRHAACPVLVGNKWVSNKWIHERGQEFRRRCGLQKTD